MIVDSYALVAILFAEDAAAASAATRDWAVPVSDVPYDLLRDRLQRDGQMLAEGAVPRAGSD